MNPSLELDYLHQTAMTTVNFNRADPARVAAAVEKLKAYIRDADARIGELAEFRNQIRGMEDVTLKRTVRRLCDRISVLQSLLQEHGIRIPADL